jgi:DNA-directed RNA polymerase subunit RPC12/RpoP
MNDIKFSCPQCQQHIQCEEGYAGMEIGCPSCSARMVVPGRPAAPPPPPPPPANPCPGCGAALAPAAILCTHCGFNLRTGQRMPARSASVPAQDAWWRSSTLYIGLLVAVLAVLYFFARSNNEGALFGYLALFVLFSLTVQIIVIVAAFREDVGTGFLTLCIPFYAIYFVYFRSESPLLKKLYTVSIIATLASRTLKGIE